MTTLQTTDHPLHLSAATVRYGATLALDTATFSAEPGRVIGLIGQNGAGKTTLLHVAAGLTIPTSGSCETLGTRSDILDTPQLTRIGHVSQEPRFLEWMTIRQQLDFTSSFYPGWDFALEKRLIDELEVPVGKHLNQLNPGDRQKTALLMGVCHHPSLLLLDEPMSALDPLARRRAVDLLFELLRDDGCTIVISSHLLTDVEKVADWIVFMAGGKIVENAPLDELQERYAEWTLIGTNGHLPTPIDAPFILRQTRTEATARLLVRLGPDSNASDFAARLAATVQTRFLSLDEIFPLLTGKDSKR